MKIFDTAETFYDAIESVLEGQDLARENLAEVQKKSKILLNEYIGDMTYDIIPVKHDKSLAEKRTKWLDRDLTSVNGKMKEVISAFYDAEKKIKSAKEKCKGAESLKILNVVCNDISDLATKIENQYRSISREKDALMSKVNEIISSSFSNNTEIGKFSASISEMGDALKKAEILTIREISSSMYQGTLANLKGREQIKIPVRETEKERDTNERFL